MSGIGHLGVRPTSAADEMKKPELGFLIPAHSNQYDYLASALN